MRGVLGKIRCDGISPSKKRPADLRKAILQQRAANSLPLEFLELETAKEILGEVFNTTLSDVDEMIQQRMTEMDAVMSVGYRREIQLEICPSSDTLDGYSADTSKSPSIKEVTRRALGVARHPQ